MFFRPQEELDELCKLHLNKYRRPLFLAPPINPNNVAHYAKAVENLSEFVNLKSEQLRMFGLIGGARDALLASSDLVIIEFNAKWRVFKDVNGHFTK